MGTDVEEGDKDRNGEKIGAKIEVEIAKIKGDERDGSNVDA